jgi:hypothetical protein
MSPVQSILSGERANRTYQIPGAKTTDQPQDTSGPFKNTDGLTKGQVQEISEIQDLLALISEITSNLFEVSTKLRKATPRDRKPQFIGVLFPSSMWCELFTP